MCVHYVFVSQFCGFLAFYLSHALGFIVLRLKESNSYLLIILLEEGNSLCFSISNVEQSLALVAR